MVGRSDIAAQVSAAVQIGQGPVSLVNAAIYHHVARASQSSEVKYEHCCDVDHCPRRPVLIKIGRNQLCPCGSGKKYKRCHGSNTALPPPQPSASKDDIQQMIQRHEAAERIRQNQQGFGRPIVSFRAFDRQIVAVGDTIYHSTNWKTFPDFLAHYMKTVLGSDWGNAELKKPVADRHPIVQWYDVVCRYQADTIKEKGKVAAAPMIGAVACYLGTAYNLYLLKHNVELQGRLVKRLKNPEQF
jgi:hypothetical protein